ncbi:MAG: DUF1848 domain-containing protein [Desulfuromonadia bacterium]
MIISASRRTDIPAWHSDWFMERIREGSFLRVNPFNQKQSSVVTLAPERVDAICFWSKNPRPLLPHLDELDDRGFRYYFQFTLNPYDSRFEPHLPPLPQRIDTFHRLADRIGNRRVIWRYDPVILSSATPISWHIQQMGWLAESLSGKSRRMVISFCDFTGGLGRRFRSQCARHGIVVHDLAAPDSSGEREAFCRQAASMAALVGVEIVSCGEGVDLSSFGITAGRCIDPVLIGELVGRDLNLRKDRSQRKWCGCVQSVDMGVYGTCRHGCIYCYAERGGPHRHWSLTP